MQTDFAIGWMTLSLINSGLAQGKDRSGFGWWLLSVFLGPLATFLIVVLPRGVPEVQEDAPNNSFKPSPLRGLGANQPGSGGPA